MLFYTQNKTSDVLWHEMTQIEFAFRSYPRTHGECTKTTLQVQGTLSYTALGFCYRWVFSMGLGTTTSSAVLAATSQSGNSPEFR